MGSFIEINDTLQITAEQGFPADVLNLEKHLKTPVTLDDVKGKIFHFYKKDSARIFHLDPVRVFLVQSINGKWLIWGKALIQSQTIEKQLDESGQWIDGKWQTNGTYTISEIYEPEYQELFTKRESVPGKSYL